MPTKYPTNSKVTDFRIYLRTLIQEFRTKILVILFRIFTVANQALQNDDAFYIFDHFDTFFSVIAEASHVQIRDLVRAIDILYRTTEKLGQMLDAYLKQETLDRQNDFLNLTKMVMYLMVSTVKEIDTVVKNYMAQSSAAAGRKNKKNTDDQLPYYASYDTKRHEVLVQVCNIMQLPIEKLWNMSIVEEDFVK